MDDVIDAVALRVADSELLGEYEDVKDIVPLVEGDNDVVELLDDDEVSVELSVGEAETPDRVTVPLAVADACDGDRVDVFVRVIVFVRVSVIDDVADAAARVRGVDSDSTTIATSTADTKSPQPRIVMDIINILLISIACGSNGNGVSCERGVGMEPVKSHVSPDSTVVPFTARLIHPHFGVDTTMVMVDGECIDPVSRITCDTSTYDESSRP